MKKTENHWVSVMYPEISMGFCFKVLKGSIRTNYSNNKNTSATPLRTCILILYPNESQVKLWCDRTISLLSQWVLSPVWSRPRRS